MASKATERIARTMSKLRMEGKLDKPYYPNGKPKPKAPQKQPPLVVEHPTCCLHKYGSNIPAYFRRCNDCPAN